MRGCFAYFARKTPPFFTLLVGETHEHAIALSRRVEKVSSVWHSWYHSGVNIAFSLLDRIPVFTFALVLAGGFLAGYFWMRWGEALATDDWVPLAGWVLLGSLIGSRAGYVLLHWAYFQTCPLDIPQFWLGGLTWWGAVPGALLALLLIAQFASQSVSELGDQLRPMLTSFVVSVWLGCWLTGAGYGLPVKAWWAVPAVDAWGLILNRWPVQLAGALLTLIAHRGVDALPKNKPNGLAASFQLALIHLIVWGLAPFRADLVPVYGSLRLDSWFALGLAVFFAALGLVLWLYNIKISQLFHKRLNPKI